MNVFDVEPLGLKDRFSGELVGAANALRTDALAAQVIHRFDVRFRDQAMQRLVGQHRDNFERHALHGAGDDIAEAQGVMHFAAHQRRHRHLAAHLNQQGFEILIFEKPSRHSHLRRQKGVAPATVGDNYFVRRVGRVQRPKGKGDGNSEPVANFHTRLFTSWQMLLLQQNSFQQAHIEFKFEQIQRESFPTFIRLDKWQLAQARNAGQPRQDLAIGLSRGRRFT